MALLVALVYFSMPLGICIIAAGKQRVWSGVQCLCVVTSVVLDPLLVPLFQLQNGNGGLGLCVAAVVSEMIMIAFGVALVPSGVFDRRLGRLMLLALASGVAMALTARIAKPLTPYIAAPLSLFAYVGAMWLTGGIDKNQFATIGRAMGRSVPPGVPGVPFS